MLDAGRAAVAALTGMSGADVVFTTGSNHALDILLGSWPGDTHRRLPARRVRPEPGGHGAPTDSRCARCRPTASAGSLVDDGRPALAADPPALVHLTPLASHRGVAQPLAELAEVCRELGVPLVVDAAQALGHLDCAVGAAAIYSARRANGWPAREVSACWRSGPSSRSGCGRGCRRRNGAAATGDASGWNTARRMSLRGWGFRWHSGSTWPRARPDPRAAGRARPD